MEKGAVYWYSCALLKLTIETMIQKTNSDTINRTQY